MYVCFCLLLHYYISQKLLFLNTFYFSAGIEDGHTVHFVTKTPVSTYVFAGNITHTLYNVYLTSYVCTKY